MPEGQSGEEGDMIFLSLGNVYQRESNRSSSFIDSNTEFKSWTTLSH